MNDDITKVEVMIARAKAVREAMVEVMHEQQAEIIRRAQEKLRAQGFPIEGLEAELGA